MIRTDDRPIQQRPDRFDAARTIALPILEADPELVERIARLLSTIQGTIDEYTPEEIEGWAKQILAALTPPALEEL